MENQKGYLKSLQILHAALLLGQLIFGIIVILLVSNGVSASGNSIPGNIFLGVALVLSLVLVVMSYKLFRIKLDEAKQQDQFTDKLNGYRAAFVLQLGLCEGATLLTIICYFLTGNKSLLWVLLLLIINFASRYPAKSKIIQQMELGGGEESLLE